mgnify:CR=1 FL=1
MPVEVRVPTILRGLTDGAKTVNADGADVQSVITDLDRQFPGMADRLVDSSGLRRFINIYVNDEDIRFVSGLTTPLRDGDAVTILPAVAGG